MKYKMTQKHKDNLSKSRLEGLRKGKITTWNKGKKGLQVAWNKGKHHSKETIEKIRNKNLGKKHSQEFKDKHKVSFNKILNNLGTIICKECNKEIKKNNYGQKYCKKCLYKLERKNRSIRQRTRDNIHIKDKCENCG